MQTVVPYRVRQLQEREREILRVAAELLAESGYQEISMDEIAARIGVSKGTLYSHFPSKEALMVALAQQRLTTLATQLRRVRHEAATPSEALARALHLLLCSHGQVWRLVGDTAGTTFQALRANPDVQRLLDELIAVVEDLVEWAKAEGVCAAEIPTEVAARSLGALAHVFPYRRLLERGDVSEAQLSALLARIYLGGLVAPAEQPGADGR